MHRILILYYSSSGNTSKMAELIAEGIKSEGLEPRICSIEKVDPAIMAEFEAIIIGSPTYYGGMASQVKRFIDQSVKYHGDLEGKIGGAFSSSANIGGGNETTVMSILHAFIIHGMIVFGDHQGDHYGPVSIGVPDKRAIEICRRYGARIASLVKKIFPVG